MNCADKMNEVVKALGKFDEFLDCTLECKDEWDQNYAVMLVDIHEEDYRDYDKVEREVFDCIQEVLGKSVKFVHGRKATLPEKGYVLHIWHMNTGLCFELELYKVKAG